MVDYLTFRLLAAQDPRGRSAAEKWVQTASAEQIDLLVSIVMNPPAEFVEDTELRNALSMFETVLRECGYLK